MLLLVIGWRAFESHGSIAADAMTAYYGTAAQVIVTLYVAIAVDATKSNSKPAIEHWLFLLVSSVGLLAAIRGLLEDSAVFFCLSLSGAVAALAVVIDGFIHRHGADLGWLWTLAFLFAVAALLVGL